MKRDLTPAEEQQLKIAQNILISNKNDEKAKEVVRRLTARGLIRVAAAKVRREQGEGVSKARSLLEKLGSKYMYHFTTKDKMYDILETGLRPRKGKIYLFPEESLQREDMIDWVRERFGHKSGDFMRDPKVALLKVNVDGMEIRKANLDEHYAVKPISKDRISVETENYIY